MSMIPAIPDGIISGLESHMFDDDSVFHVGKHGSDTADGKAKRRAKLTINGALTEAANRSITEPVILVYRGEYNERVDATSFDGLTMIGSPGWGSRLYTAGSAATPASSTTSANRTTLLAPSKCFLKNMRISHTGGAVEAELWRAIWRDTAGEWFLMHDCKVDAGQSAVVLGQSYNNVDLRGCHIKGGEFGLVVGQKESVVVHNCRIRVADYTICNASALIVQARYKNEPGVSNDTDAAVIVSDTSLHAQSDTVSSFDGEYLCNAMALGGGGRVKLVNSDMVAIAGGNLTIPSALTMDISSSAINGNSAFVHLVNCSMFTDRRVGVTAPSAPDQFHMIATDTNNEVYVDKCIYDPAKVDAGVNLTVL